MLNLFAQNKLGVFQGLVVEQPVQLRPLCRGVAVLILHSDAVDGKGDAILEQGGGAQRRKQSAQWAVA